MSFKQKYFGDEAWDKFRQFFSIMIPILITWTAIMAPLTAHLLRAGEKAETGRIIRYGLLLALRTRFVVPKAEAGQRA